jgi:hypothetical protein
MAKPGFFKGGANVINMSKSILYNRGVLYFMVILALGNLFMFLSRNDLVSVAVFVLIGILTSFFSKNMVVILCISVVVSNIIRFGVKIGMEGLTEGADGDEEEEEKEEGFEEGADGEEEEEKEEEGLTEGKDDDEEEDELN